MSAPPDAAGRERITDELGATLFVEAGAGAGKTTALVQRIVNLVVQQHVPITSIAAITFTEKAAAELRVRLRGALESLAPDQPAAATAATELDHAAIGTLHAFCRRILFEFPIDAGLPPGFTVLDELQSSLAFDEAWEDLMAALLDSVEPDDGIASGGADFVALCEYADLRLDRSLRAIANDFRNDWDLVETRVDRSAPGELELDIDAAVALGQRVASANVPEDDKQQGLVSTTALSVERMTSATTFREQLDALAVAVTAHGKWGASRPRAGNKTTWSKAGFPDGALDDLRDLEQEFGAAISALDTQVREYRKHVIGAVLGRFVLDAATTRARTGKLEFHDLLVLTRRLLVTNDRVRAALHGRYQRVLLDEFQDTDPIQFEVAVRLTSAPTATGPWRSLQPLPGRLFVVGDPKQSIYRFRRADIAEYLRAADQIAADRVVLSANFRSTSAVIDFVNSTFDELIAFEPDVQPQFTALSAQRAAAQRQHGSVHLVGTELHADLDGWKAADNDGVGAADELRRREADDLAAAVHAAISDGWRVGAAPHEPSDSAGLRPCRPSDICVLLPTRLPLPALEAALSARHIPYRAENSSVVYATTEVRHVLGVLRAADDPTDELALMSSLRTPLYGCSDVELYEWRSQGGSWHHRATTPEHLADHPVAHAIAHVRSVADRVDHLSAADLLAAIIEERRALELALDGLDGRDVWRRLRYVVDQARAWADAGGHGIRRYLRWAMAQAEANRVSDAILPETDHDVVRVMTIHAAKGLEFPITVVGGLTTVPSGSRIDSVSWTPTSWVVKGRADDGGYENVRPLDEAMSDAERRRLLYVACTRAVDHLVVSLHRGSPPTNSSRGAGGLTSAQLLASVIAAPAELTFERPAAERAASQPARTLTSVSTIAGLEAAELPWFEQSEWAAEQHRALDAASRRTAIAATRLADELTEAAAAALRDAETGSSGPVDDPGLDKHPVDIELPPWQRGRYGTSIGRAVHGVLQFCDLSNGSDIDALAAAQCAAEGILGLATDVALLARSALLAPIVIDAANGRPHRRELFVAAPVGDRVLEGYIDLLVKTDAGYVIVDYKTDKWPSSTPDPERLERYRLQLAAYGAALGAVLTEPIVGGLLVRCRPDRAADQIEIPRWDEALQSVTEMMTS